jgi:glycosyltransferase involved in cell wall biosynthesis
MRILRIVRSVEDVGGGPINWVLNSSKLLSGMGHTVEVVTLDAPGKICYEDFPFKIYAMGQAFGKYGYAPKYVSWLKKHASDYDVILIHGLWQYSGFGAWLALRNTGMPYYVQTHGMLAPWFKKNFPLKHIKKMLYWLLAEHRVLRDAKSVFFTSEEERVSARNQFWPYRFRQKVINYGTSLPPQDKANKKNVFLNKFPELRDKELILFLGRIHPKKGCDILIEAFCHAAINRRALHLVMAGPDEIGWRNKLEKMTAKAGMSERVTWTGMLSGDLKWGAFYAADAFILPSHHENFGIAVAEALACGSAVLISDKVNTWKEIESDGAGIVAPDDKAGTEKLLDKWICLSDNEKAAMRDSAKRCFLQRFEIDKATQGLIDIFNDRAEAR